MAYLVGNPLFFIERLIYLHRVNKPYAVLLPVGIIHNKLKEMTEKKDISKMSPEEIKEMHKEWEMAERKESRKKHEEIQEEYKPHFGGLCDSIITHFHIAPNVIKNLLPHPITSSTDAFNGKFGTVTGLILFFRRLFEQIGAKFDLKILLKMIKKCIKWGFNLQISIIDPSHPDKPIQTVTIFYWQETVVSKTFENMIEEKRNKTHKKD